MKQFYLYSATTNSFYPVSAPADAVQITEEKHTELFDGQSSGLAIKPGKDGYPTNTRQGESFEEWDSSQENWVIDEDAKAKHDAELDREEKEREINELESQLDQVEKRIMRLERIKQRTDSEEIELDELIDESTELFRAIESLKTALETEDEEKEE